MRSIVAKRRDFEFLLRRRTARKVRCLAPPSMDSVMMMMMMIMMMICVMYVINGSLISYVIWSTR